MKQDLSLIPYVALLAEAEAFEVGAKKHGRLSFCSSASEYRQASQHVSAIMRHLGRWFWDREEIDPDGQHHLGSVRARAAILIDLIDRGLLVDDRPPEKDS